MTSSQAVTPTSAQLDTFRRSFGGEVITPDAAGYDDARRVWNAMFDRRPAMVVRPTSVDDVVAAVRFGRERDLEIAVRGGGHSAVGHSTTDGGLVIDLGRMNTVSVDKDRRLARTGGGALLGTLDIAAQEHGLVCPVGVVGHTGVAGLTLGGGVGRLQRRYGLTIDSLRAVELVTADGRLVRATADEEPELFWGLRGAGANFGVATSLELELQPFSGTLHRGVHVHPATDIQELWPIFREFMAATPDTIAAIFTVALAEPAADCPASRPVPPAQHPQCAKRVPTARLSGLFLDEEVDLALERPELPDGVGRSVLRRHATLGILLRPYRRSTGRRRAASPSSS